MMPPGYQPIFALHRGEHLESLHYGAVAVVDVHGALRAWLGDPQQAAFLRSAAKPFQALPFVVAGGVAHYQLTPQELALLCASHSGTPAHVAVFEGLLQKFGLQAQQLLCGTHPPYHAASAEELRARGEAPNVAHHNCSGKHCGMLAYAKLRGWRLDDYIDPQHPLQQEIVALFAELAGMRVEQLAIGVDGCSAPNWAAPLAHTAWAYARLADPAGLPEAQAQAAGQIADAMRAHPDMVAGPRRFDTACMQHLPGLISKLGAEGFQAFGLPAGFLGPQSPALGIAIKIADGDARQWASHAVALEVLRQLGALDAGRMAALADYGPLRPVTNWSGQVVGQAAPCFTLELA
ncbi:MAG: asparaginase [Anaerolineales bacterium]|jgi:L-asparaginase II|nr:asparaginase [Anaerolineales bacterium]MBX3005315.1 asparaginase [Anaerolineales bacterium]MCW5838484.1 asparaginase [Anaerolineales bacterium]MCW5887151.1 asparaginase [Anaerolineales bacterium]